VQNRYVRLVFNEKRLCLTVSEKHFQVNVLGHVFHGDEAGWDSLVFDAVTVELFKLFIDDFQGFVIIPVIEITDIFL